jgi:hypothetical protein
LCDLNAQPNSIKEIIDTTVRDAQEAKKDISQVGFRLLKFCASYDLQKISEQAESYSAPLNAKYV